MKLTHTMNRDEWLAWRRNRVGASDVPALMGLFGFEQRYSVWARLAGISDDEPLVDTPEMKFGRDVEKTVLDNYAMQAGEEILRQEIHICDEIPQMHATLDGFYIDRSIKGAPKVCIVEVKCFSGAKMRLLEAGTVPWSVALQVQAQMMCAKADVAYVIGYGATTAVYSVVRVERNDLIQQEISGQVKYIVDCATRMLRINDYRYDFMGGEMDISAAIQGYIDTMPTADEAAKQERHKMFEEQIKAHVVSTGQSLSSMGVCAKVSKVKGRVRYSDVPELLGVDLDKYRGADSLSVRIQYSGSK